AALGLAWLLFGKSILDVHTQQPQCVEVQKEVRSVTNTANYVRGATRVSQHKITLKSHHLRGIAVEICGRNGLVADLGRGGEAREIDFGQSPSASAQNVEQHPDRV